ncbi:hypothetical protein FOA52_001885 [Chlamydomonas sp. UWO 241]|nr:hypothetical protein FOA52_001885 [Chlamydomonas sp. UWO 241]
MIDSEELKRLVDEHKVGGIVMGGTGLFRADGGTHYGARKLISGVAGIIYDSDWLPTVKRDPRVDGTPIWLCRGGNNDPCSMLLAFIRLHAPQHAAPAR